MIRPLDEVARRVIWVCRDTGPDVHPGAWVLVDILREMTRIRVELGLPDRALVVDAAPGVMVRRVGPRGKSN